VVADNIEVKRVEFYAENNMLGVFDRSWALIPCPDEEIELAYADLGKGIPRAMNSGA
jgi:hypothetical protein